MFSRLLEGRKKVKRNVIEGNFDGFSAQFHPPKCEIKTNENILFLLNRPSYPYFIFCLISFFVFYQCNFCGQICQTNISYNCLHFTFFTTREHNHKITFLFITLPLLPLLYVPFIFFPKKS